MHAKQFTVSFSELIFEVICLLVLKTFFFHAGTTFNVLFYYRDFILSAGFNRGLYYTNIESLLAFYQIKTNTGGTLAQNVLRLFFDRYFLPVNIDGLRKQIIIYKNLFYFILVPKTVRCVAGIFIVRVNSLTKK